MKRTLAAVTFVTLLCLAGRPARAAATWKKLADAPADIAGREMPPGMDGAWCWVPELKGFLLYGSYSPRLTNEGWLFDPARCEMKLLWADDSLGYDEKTKKWRALMPREIHWSLGRPGPARGRAAVYSPATKKVYLFGGHPGGAKSRAWFGGTQLGTWELDPATMKFKHLGDSGPKGFVKAVYDSDRQLIVVAPMRLPYGKKGIPPTWVFDPAKGAWDKRTPAGPRPGPHPGFAYDPKVRKCVYFSGYGETWTYDAARNGWKNMKPAKSPPPRWHAAMAFAPKLGVTVLHGGVGKKKDSKNPWSKTVQAFHSRDGTFFGDTWTYDGTKNEWKELKAGGPGKSASARDLCALDTRTGALVFYDPATGIWALNAPEEYKKLAGAPRKAIPEAVLKIAANRLAKLPEPDAAAKTWQQKVRAMPDDSWLDPKVRKPTQGCISFGYNPKAEFIYWVAGCRGASFATHDDYSYNNQVILFDMVAGKWFQRRSNHPWMPKSSLTHRQGNGCGRAVCYDGKRDVIWTVGGVTGFALPGVHRMQTYDFAADRMGPAAKQGLGWGADCGMVYDTKNDLIVLVKGQYRPLDTYVFSPATEKWRKGADHPPKFSLYTRVVYDPKTGVILVGAVPKAWELGGRLPGDRKRWSKMPLVTRAYAYDAAADKWRDLAPAGAEKVSASRGSLGVAYDPRRRLLYAITNNTGGGYGAPRKPVNVAVLDLKANRWERGKDSPPLPAMNKSSAVYDARRNVVVVGAGSGLYLYRPKDGCPEDAFKAKK